MPEQIIAAVTEHLQDMFDWIFVAGEFPKEKEIEELQRKADDDNKDSMRQLQELGTSIGSKTMEVKRQYITSELIKTVDDMFEKNLADSPETLGIHEDDNFDCYIKYRNQVINGLQMHLGQHRGDAVAQGLKANVRAKLLYMMDEHCAGFIGYMPFVTLSVPIALDEGWGKVNAAITEVSFDCAV